MTNRHDHQPPQTPTKVLVVDDDRSMRDALCDTLELEGYLTVKAASAADALAHLYRDSGDVDLVLSDIHMQPQDGLSLLASVQHAQMNVPVILMTAFGSVDQAVEAMRSGASDYLVKPFEAQDLLDKVASLRTGSVNKGYVFDDPHMLEVAKMARRVAASDATVMISGESGVGKEVIARYIHASSQRSDKPFVAINCAAIPENMLEAMLFGYEKGAFTGAIKTTPGKFELAQGGTLLLDEISEMDLGLQAKLLRVIQEKEVERIGGQTTIALDVRLLATTNRSLRQEVKEGRFREDLYYRLNVFPVHMPALRDRTGDIRPIAQLLLDKHTPRGALIREFSDGAMRRLHEYHWPGNVRELENVVQRALVLSRSRLIETHDVLFERHEPEVTPSDDTASLDSDLKSREIQMIVEMLRSVGGSRKLASERLGVSPRTLRYKLARMREQGIEIPESTNPPISTP